MLNYSPSTLKENQTQPLPILLEPRRPTGVSSVPLTAGRAKQAGQSGQVGQTLLSKQMHNIGLQSYAPKPELVGGGA